MAQDNSSTAVEPVFVDHLLDSAPVVLFATDKNGIITLSRGQALTALGLGQDELVGQSVYELYTNEPNIAELTTRALNGETEVVQLTLNGITHRTRFAPLMDSAGEVQGIVGVSTDVTAQVEAQRSLERLARFDSLTGLPNRNSLHEYIQSAIEATPLTPFAVAIVGMNRFREVNQTFGYGVGDQAIKAISERFVAEFQESGEYYARASGDELGIVLSGRDARTLRDRVHQRVRRIFQEPVIIRDQPLALEASTGLAFFPGHGEDADKLIRRADTAMHVAKDNGLAHVSYDRDRDEPKINNIQLIADLRRAIESDEAELQFQPQFDLASGRIASVEALFRWPRLQSYGMNIGELMLVAERSGVIYLLDAWVLNTAVETYTALARQGTRLPLAVNSSARSFQRPHFAQEVADLVDVWGMPPADLCVEITETAMVHDHGQLRTTCAELREAGIGVAIDDFGTGNSSLVYLKDLGVSAIKIDTVFIIQFATDRTAQTLAHSIIDMGNNLGVRVIAEGVEDDATLELLKGMGCHEVQGFHTGRPAPLADLVNQMHQRDGNG